MKPIALTLLFLASAAFAQDKPKEQPKTPAVPVISDKQQKDFFKAKAAVADAQAQLSNAQNNLSAQVNGLMAFCGPTAGLQLDPTGDLVCISKDARQSSLAPVPQEKK